MDYETLIKNIDKDVDDLEQLRTTPLLAGCNNWSPEIQNLKILRDILTSIKNMEDELEQLKAMNTALRGIFKKEIPSLTRKFRFKNQVRLIKTIGEVEDRLEALDPNEYSIFDLDSARQQLGYARQEANRKLTEMDLWEKAAAWCSSKLSAIRFW